MHRQIGPDLSKKVRINGVDYHGDRAVWHVVPHRLYFAEASLDLEAQWILEAWNLDASGAWDMAALRTIPMTAICQWWGI
jgi:hypothetical protein